MKTKKELVYKGMVGACNSKKKWLVGNLLTDGGLILLAVGLMIKNYYERWIDGETFLRTTYGDEEIDRLLEEEKNSEQV